MPQTNESKKNLSFPSVAVITANGGDLSIMTVDGEILTKKFNDRLDMGATIGNAPVLTCHAPWMAQKIDLPHYPAFDALELFAFVHAGKFTTPTVKGVAKTLNLHIPEEQEDLPFLLIEVCQTLLKTLQNFEGQDKEHCISIAKAMGRQNYGWAWTPYVLEALGITYDDRLPTNPKEDMHIFDTLPEWAEEAPPPPNKFDPVTGEESREYLQTLLMRR
ncbi:MAG: hypothetical protein COB76_05245, partial [Alphaproteobacteria bacterium]